VERGGAEAEAASLVGADKRSDVALLRAKPAAGALEWAEALPEVGEWVFALGNPFGAAPGSLSLGVLSGLRRLVPGPNGTLVGLVQTDAALNQGNSGGPLLDASGRVVGVNTAILSPSGANAGIGFAVPAATARRIVEALRDKGKVEHPSLGVTGKAEARPCSSASCPAPRPRGPACGPAT
jgi:S1-C subfamily serine protease